MNKDQFFGLLRELANAIGMALVTYGVMEDTTATLFVGAALSIISLFAAIGAHEGPEILRSILRKVLTGIAGVLAAYGVLDPAKLEAIISIVMILAGLAWSYTAKTPAKG